MNRQRVVEALHARGDSLPATASLADLQQRLMTCLLRERRETDFPGSASTLASRTDGEPGPGVPGQPGSEARAGSSGGTSAEAPALEDADALLTAVCPCPPPSVCAAVITLAAALRLFSKAFLSKDVVKSSPSEDCNFHRSCLTVCPLIVGCTVAYYPHTFKRASYPLQLGCDHASG